MKTKCIYFLSALFILLFNNSCDKKLDIQPLSILTPDQTFDNSSGITAYMASIYGQLPIENFSYTIGGRSLANQTDESISSYANEQSSIPDGTWYPWWEDGYKAIRSVNDLIERLPTANISTEEKNHLMGEALFIRAFDYFGLVKRYGGVPIIKEVQDFTGGNVAELQVSRNTEKEVWDFISTELDLAISLLPEVNESGRATKNAALALKSRAMMYAASIAKYGAVALNGVIGLSASDANRYWQQSYDAAKLIIDSDKHLLYSKNPDKKLNFEQLFIDPENPEAIFSVYYQYPHKGHSYDAANLPFGIRGPGGSGSNLGPTLEMAEQYEYVDGSPGKLKLQNADGSPIFYNNPTDLFENKDPRFLATVIVPFATFDSKVVDVQAGIYDQGIKVEAGDFSALYNPITHQPDNINGTLHIVGLSGFGGTEKTQTGFYIRKYLDFNLDQLLAMGGNSDVSWIEFRYAEVLLNFAEASYELNKISDAKWAINEIRNRAGIKLLEDAEITLDRIRHERLVELAFENHRWWDYKRWRISDKVLNNTRFSALKPYYDIQAEGYRFETAVAGRWPKTFDAKVYYQRIDPGEIASNPNLIQNPNY